MFELLASILEFFYDVWPSFGMAIILLTLAVRLVLTPLTVKGTKSMLEMRKLQPEIKKIQKKHKNDRQELNRQLQGLYSEHKINPLGGCLPLLAQIPVFFVLYQVLRGLTRRLSNLGYAAGNYFGGGERASAEIRSGEAAEFNPEYLDSSDNMYQALSGTNEMISWGLDLSLTPWSVLNDNLFRGMPYLGLILATGFLSWLQQRQIAGRNDGDINPQQRIIMRIVPIFIPIISFNLPTGIVVYFLTTSLVGVLQQDFLTRRIYAPHKKAEAQKEKAKANKNTKEAEEEKEEEPEEPERPKGLAGLFGSAPEDPSRHGSSPFSKPAKKPPPKAQKPEETTPTPPKQKANPGQKSKPQNNKTANKSKKGKGKPTPTPAPPKPASKRVTPKKKDDPAPRRRRRR